MENESFACVWDALFPDDSVTRTDRRLRSVLLIALAEHIQEVALDRTQLARQLEISTDRLHRIQQGKINDFELTDLVTLCARAGLKVEVSVRAADNAPQPDEKGQTASA